VADRHFGRVQNTPGIIKLRFGIKYTSHPWSSFQILCTPVGE